jgi:hypothetical protein
VAGPDAADGFTDVRTNKAQTAVSLDGNVYLSGLLAGLLDRGVKAGECHGGRGETVLWLDFVFASRMFLLAY